MAITATWVSPSRVNVEITGDLGDQAQTPISPGFSVLSSPHNWTIAPVDDEQYPVTIYNVETEWGGAVTGDTLALLRVGPASFPGVQYSITVPVQSLVGGQVASTTETLLTTTPANFAETLSGEWSHGLIQSLTETIGDSLQKLNGRPQTLTVQDLSPGDVSIFVESTLGFPPFGILILKGRPYEYTTIEPMAFRGVAPVNGAVYRTALGKKTLVTFDVRSHFPD